MTSQPRDFPLVNSLRFKPYLMKFFQCRNVRRSQRFLGLRLTPKWQERGLGEVEIVQDGIVVKHHTVVGRFGFQTKFCPAAVIQFEVKFKCSETWARLLLMSDLVWDGIPLSKIFLCQIQQIQLEPPLGRMTCRRTRRADRA